MQCTFDYLNLSAFFFSHLLIVCSVHHFVQLQELMQVEHFLQSKEQRGVKFLQVFKCSTAFLEDILFKLHRA